MKIDSVNHYIVLPTIVFAFGEQKPFTSCIGQCHRARKTEIENRNFKNIKTS